VAVLATAGLAHQTLPDRPELALAAAALLAFNPQFVFISTAISNDVAVTAAAALALWAMAALLRHGPTRGRLIVLGASLGLAVLAKLSGLWLLPLAVAVIAWAWWRGPRTGAARLTGDGPTTGNAGPGGPSIRGLAAAALWALLPALLIGGWWYGRNALLFGDLTGLPLMLSVMTPRPEPPGLRELAEEAVAVWKSFWAVFGWFNVVAPDWVYRLTSAVTVIGLLGLAVAAARRRLPRSAWPGLLLAGAWVALMVLAMLLWARLRYPQGRLLFPAAPALALLVAAGWVLPWPRAVGRLATAGLALGLAGLAAWLLPNVILPAYAAPRPTPASPGGMLDVSAPSPPPVFGEVLELAMWTPPPEARAAGEPLDLTLWWRPTRAPDRDYSVALHLVDEDGVVVGQRLSLPGGGSIATSDLTAGEVVSDTHRITIPFTAGSPPCRCSLQVGLYDAERGEALPLYGQARMVPIVRPTLAIDAPRDAAGRPRLPAPVHFGDELVLEGYDLHRRALDAGQKLKLTAYWRALARPAADYRVSIQLRDGDRIVAQEDHGPMDDQHPTREWRPGETVADTASFRVPHEAPPGDYTLYLILVRPDGRPLPVAYRDLEYSLGPVRVTGDE
jgi:hypothetical protein